MKTKGLLRLLALLLTVGMLFGYTSCVTSVSAAELTGGLSRNKTDEPTSAQIAAGEKALAGFGFALWEAALNEGKANGGAPENSVFSPLSALYCLGMLAKGANGETLAQMETAFGCTAEDLGAYLRWYNDRLASDGNGKVVSANSVWMREEDKDAVLPAYLQALVDLYAAQAYAAPFDESTVADINRWCEKHTDGMIDELLKNIPADTVLYLINALSFDAKWQDTYEKKQITDRVFTSCDGRTAELPFLHSDESVYLAGKGFTGFVKPYAGGKYAFVGLLPDEEMTDANTAAAALSGETWQAIWQKRERTPVAVAFPEFKAESETPLAEALKTLGICDAFAGNADFSRMANIPLYCSEVRQKAVVEVDRNGTKAAAVTEARMAKSEENLSVKKSVVLDRPFVWAIVDTETGMPLFCGTVNRLG